MASFLFNALTNGADVVSWKYTNLMIHLLNGVLVFWLSAHLLDSRRDLSAHLLDSRRDVSDPRCLWGALIVGTVWLLHPLHVSTVLYTVQRMTQLSSLFVLAGLLAYVLGRKRQLRGEHGLLPIALTFFVFLPLAALSKENGILLPLLVFVVEVCVFQFAGDGKTRRIVGWYFFAFLLVPVVLGVLLLAYQSDLLFLGGYAAREFSLKERLLTESRVLFLYLHELIVPIQKNMGFFHDDIAISHGWLDPPTTLISTIGIALLLGFACCIRRRVPLLALGILFFFSAHLLESTIFPLELAYEHRNYLPSYGLFLGLVGGLKEIPLRRILKIGLVLGTVLMLAFLTSFRAQTWSSEASLWSYFYRVHPNSLRVNAQIAEGLTTAGHYREALLVVDRFEGNGPALQRLYIECRKDRSLRDEELESLLQSLSSPIDLYAVTGLLETGRLGLDGHCEFSDAHYVRVLEKALSLKTKGHSAHKIRMFRAHFLWRLNRIDMAIAALETAYRVTPIDPLPLFLAAEWLIDLGEIERARSYYSRAKKVTESSRFSYRDFIDSIGSALRTSTDSDSKRAFSL